jgi:hypothetical protein
MERIWADRKAAELTARSAEEIKAQRRALREDMDEDVEKAGQESLMPRPSPSAALDPPPAQAPLGQRDPRLTARARSGGQAAARNAGVLTVRR